MRITQIVVGKTGEKYLKEGIAGYEKRICHYLKYETIIIPGLKKTKNLSVEEQKAREGELIAAQFQAGDFIVLLDENGKEYSSKELSRFIQQRMNSGIKRLVFVIGGPYGFADEVYQKADAKLALSRLTFSHQMVRLFFAEQIYRAMTILKNEPYHH